VLHTSGVKIICSCADGTPPQRALKERSWRELKLSALSDAECGHLIHATLGLYGKQIDKEQEKLVWHTPHLSPHMGRLMMM